MSLDNEKWYLIYAYEIKSRILQVSQLARGNQRKLGIMLDTYNLGILLGPNNILCSFVLNLKTGS